ncbi:hypothetical protein KP509_27G064400 [Ceratopteris richardii]|uniref:PAS domain-containing protein n=1 Tax=Ceratopteris richardii TaxID=49495 RepID=A0A8T2RH79_CERRI|nr:hypothetical protein KP509_27G064400 [Ceratopteris richardii]
MGLKAPCSTIPADSKQEETKDGDAEEYGAVAMVISATSIQGQLSIHTEEGGESKSLIAPSYTATGSSRGDKVMASFKAAYNESLRDALQRAKFSFVLTDPRIHDNPIVYASDGFLEMTGYSAEEVLGRNCRFLQGPATNRRTILEIRDAIREERACQVSILNYTKQGKPFWNLFHMAPVYSKEDGRVVHFVGVQTPVKSTADHHESLTTNHECFCVSSSHSLSSLRASADVLRDGLADVEIDEEHCEVGQADEDKSKTSVATIFGELKSKCKGAGVTERKSTTVSAGFDGGRVVCSSLMLSLTKIQQSFVLANPHLPDTPIVHASEKFLQLTGYTREDVVGRNCRFLQGSDTDRGTVQLIGECLRAEKPCTVRILNYRKDKTPFWNLLHVAPVRSNAGKIWWMAVGSENSMQFATGLLNVYHTLKIVGFCGLCSLWWTSGGCLLCGCTA